MFWREGREVGGGTRAGGKVWGVAVVMGGTRREGGGLRWGGIWGVRWGYVWGGGGTSAEEGCPWGGGGIFVIFQSETGCIIRFCGTVVEEAVRSVVRVPYQEFYALSFL